MMTKVSFVPKTAFAFNKHSQGKEQDDEEEYNMASHLAEDPVRPGPTLGLLFYSFGLAC